MKVVKALGSIISSIIVFILCRILGDIELVHSIAIGLVLLLVFILVSSDDFRDCIKSLHLKISKNYHFKEVNDFFGRESIANKILDYHKNSKEPVLVGIIYGLGGSGKTALSQNFGKMAKFYCDAIKLSKNDSLPEIKKLKRNTIIFVDDAYEYLKDIEKLDLLKEFIDNVKKSEKKRVSIWYVDRTNLKRCIISILGSFELHPKEIDMNTFVEDKQKVLVEILTNKLPNYSEDAIYKYLDLIVSRFDPEYCRPIWAVMIGKILENKPNTDFDNYAGRDMLIKEYWHNQLNRNGFYSFLQSICAGEATQDDIIQLRDEAINRAESIMVLSAITSLNIIIDDSTDERIIRFISKNEEYENPELVEMICNALTIRGVKILHYMLVQLFPSDTAHDPKSEIVVKNDEYDIVTSWLLNITIKNDDRIIKKLLQQINRDMPSRIIAYVTRAHEDDDGNAFKWWFENVYSGFDGYDTTGYEEWIIQWCEMYPSIKHTPLLNPMKTVLNDFAQVIMYDEKKSTQFYDFITFLRNKSIIDRKNYDDLLNQIIKTYEPGEKTK
jgi:hypothetical protein